jgi:hypothetical protein
MASPKSRIGIDSASTSAPICTGVACSVITASSDSARAVMALPTPEMTLPLHNRT